MALILSHTTALSFWISAYAVSAYPLRNPDRMNLLTGRPVTFLRLDPHAAALFYPMALEPIPQSPGRLYAPPITIRRSSIVGKTPPSAPEIEAYFGKREALFRPPYHLLSLNKISYRRSQDTRIHTCTVQLPPRSFFQLEDAVYVVSPELCFAQIATMVNRTHLTELGFQLCGQYAVDSQGTALGFRNPVTNAAFLARQLAKMKGVSGAKAGLATTQHLCDGSASPRETHLAMMLSLPRSWGGYGLPKPTLNHRVSIPLRDRHVVDADRFYCDLYWENAKLALEYDSDAHHTGAERITHDAKRRDALALMGIETLTVTNAQIKSLDEMDRIARLVARKLNAPFRLSQEYPYRERQQKLHSELLGNKQWWTTPNDRARANTP